MSRHRNIRFLSTEDYGDDEYYDDYDDYDEGQYGSPSMAQYMYNGDQHTQAEGYYDQNGDWHYYDDEEQAWPENGEQAGEYGEGQVYPDNNDDGFHDGDDEIWGPMEGVDNTGEGAGVAESELQEGEDAQFVSMAVDALYAKLVENNAADQTEVDLVQALRGHNFDVEATAATLVAVSEADRKKGSLLAKAMDKSRPKKTLNLLDLSGEVTPKKNDAKDEEKEEEERDTDTSSSNAGSSSSSSSSSSSGTPGSRNKLLVEQSGKRSKAMQAEIDAFRAEKEHVNMVVIGHVDAGKSTLTGHLLYKLGAVASSELRKFERESRNMGKSSFHFAWVMDAEEEERSRGVTIDVGVQSFETESKRITLLDAPGHRDFIPNMISGASQADVAVLVVNAAKGEFEAGFRDGCQTKEHAMLVRSLGVKELVVAVNKLDLVEWSQERFEEIKSKVGAFLNAAGFKESNLSYIPVSGFEGINLVERHQGEIEWYDGPSLLERIDAFNAPPRLLDKPMRLPISDLYRGAGNTVVVVGRIEAGVIAPGDRVLISPQKELAVVKTVISSMSESAASSSASFQGAPMEMGWGAAGENVEVVLTGVEISVLSVGNVLCDPMHPAPVSSKFRARILTMDTPVRLGHKSLLHLHTLHLPVIVNKLIQTVDKKSGAILRKKPRFLPANSAAIVDIKLEKPICVELYTQYRQLGRFMLRENGETLCAGVVIKIKEDEA